MVDNLTPEKRTEVMKSIISEGTKPELVLRKFLFSQGFRYRKNYKKLPGRPDIVFIKKKIAIFVHGCFWHSHPGCKYATRPKSNLDYWDGKLKNNVERDKLNQKEITAMGWRSIILWECETKYMEMLQRKLETYFIQNKVIL